MRLNPPCGTSLSLCVGIGNILYVPSEYTVYTVYIQYIVYTSHFLVSKPSHINFVGCLYLGHSIPEANFS